MPKLVYTSKESKKAQFRECVCACVCVCVSKKCYLICVTGLAGYRMQTSFTQPSFFSTVKGSVATT